jgi:hypothetical protein
VTENLLLDWTVKIDNDGQGDRPEQFLPAEHGFAFGCRYFGKNK